MMGCITEYTRAEQSIIEYVDTLMDGCQTVGLECSKNIGVQIESENPQVAHPITIAQLPEHLCQTASGVFLWDFLQEVAGFGIPGLM